MIQELKTCRRAALLGSAATFVAGLTLGTSAYAQEAADEDDLAIEEVVVTGSRIARDPNVAGPSPVSVVSSTDLKLAGDSDIAEVLKDIPALLTTTSAQGSVDGIFSPSVGASVLQLRGLGNERTLVLVDGRRHVGGVQGSSAVDVGSIPNAMVERVEVLTGGASAVYGADAVTGVVNFVLRDDFEGIEVDTRTGLSGERDGFQIDSSILYGQNFDDGRGNYTVGLNYSKRNGIRFGDRSFSRNNAIADDLPNPARRFQSGDISTASTPSFFRFYNPANGRFPVGFVIPSATAFLDDFEAAFGSRPALTSAEQALINRAAGSPSRAILPHPTFSISSNRGVIIPANFSDPGLDIDGDGTSDCLQSFVGFNGLTNFSGALGAAGGCWTVNDDGSVRPYQDGLVAANFNQFGGDGIPNNFDENFLVPEDEKYVVNFTGRYEFSNTVAAFAEAKYVYQTTDFGGPLNTFYDLLTVAPDNPFIPSELQGVADASGGLRITRDPTDLGPNINTNRRETYRFVAGIEGEFNNGWTFELSGNYGRFERTTIDRNRVIQDRFFAAIDVTTDANGNPVCRSSLDGSDAPTTPFDIPLFDFGFFTFNPDDGSCVPANILGGPSSISQEAVDFITTTVQNRRILEQTVISGYISGDLADFVSLPGGEISFVVGAEYRDESANAIFDPLVRGVLPVTTPDGHAGQLVRDLGPFRQNSLVFDPASLVRNEGGSYDVKELFAEVSLPIITGEAFFEQLSLDAAARYADYSTIGSAFTWNVGGTWAPIKDISLRASYSEAIRAPNVNELFAPEQGAFFRPDDPCDQTAIDALIEANDPRGQISATNCAADGIPAGFQDPLSARFSGVTSGNPDLQEETGKTFTLGAILQPEFLPGLTLTVDYWNIEIEDAISSVSAQDIVDNCYGSANFPNQFCDLIERNTDTSSPQFNGFTFLRQTELNFASLETAGIDVSGRYAFDVDENQFTLSVSGTWIDKLDQFFDPGDPTAVDPELGELQRPEWAGVASLSWQRGPLLINWQTRYQDRQALRAVEIETADIVYGPNGFADEVFIHDVSFNYDFSENLSLYGGINNIGDKNPFITEQAFPVSPLGRFFFLGFNVTLP